MKDNPVKEWLARVAAECGSPQEMWTQGSHLKIDNTRRLVMQHAQLWQRKIDLQEEREKQCTNQS